VPTDGARTAAAVQAIKRRIRDIPAEWARMSFPNYDPKERNLMDQPHCSMP
jgi:hypothetical protein